MFPSFIINRHGNMTSSSNERSELSRSLTLRTETMTIGIIVDCVAHFNQPLDHQLHFKMQSCSSLLTEWKSYRAVNTSKANAEWKR